MSNKQLPLGEDIGYSSTKVSFKGKEVRFPTAICFATDVGTQFGEEDVYEFEGQKYYVGKEAVGEESFTTTEYKFLYKFGPLLTYHVLKKFNEHNLDVPVTLKTGLSITDWGNMKEFRDRLSSITVNGETINLDVTIIPQGAGVIIDWVNNVNGGVFPDRISVIDVGHNTINFLSYVNGIPVRKDTNGYPGHGVTSILKPFTKFLENTYSMTFSEQEAIQIFIKGTFKFNGKEDPNITNKIEEFKAQFVSKLFNSVLVNDKKTISISDVVLIAGGGALLLGDTEFPDQVQVVQDPVMANVRGFMV